MVTGAKVMFVRLNFTFQHRIVKFLNEADQKPSLCEDRSPGLTGEFSLSCGSETSTSQRRFRHNYHICVRVDSAKRVAGSRKRSVLPQIQTTESSTAE